MQLSFYGAAREVTGSCYLLEACGKNILIDCGMEQGLGADNTKELPVPPVRLDYVFLTHAHIDHSGRLPLLAKLGFAGEIYATEATTDLCQIMLRDSAHIQEFESEWRNRKGKRSGKGGFEPLYEMGDAEAIMETFIPCTYDQIVEVAEGIRIRFIDAGHLLGSSSIEVWIEEEGVSKKIVFSGDVGNINQPLIKDPTYIKEADYVIVESTYGTRLHNPPLDYAANLASVIQRTFDRGGNVVIPSFAVGRTQELLYFIRNIKAKGMVKGHEGFKVYVDSPLANEATAIFRDNTEIFDADATELIRQGINPISFEGLKLSVTADDSRAINFIDEPKVIISASGMCEAGRIKHHLKHNLWREESSIVFVGYQAVGTTGRAIVDGASAVKLFGEEIEVHAEIVILEGISGHADQKGLLNWLDAFDKVPERIFVTHGDAEVSVAFGEMLRERYRTRVSVPKYSELYDLLTGEMLREGYRQEKKAAAIQRTEEGTVYQRLRAAGDRLVEVILHNKGGANKDLAKFADQILALAEKWDR